MRRTIEISICSFVIMGLIVAYNPVYAAVQNTKVSGDVEIKVNLKDFERDWKQSDTPPYYKALDYASKGSFLEAKQELEKVKEAQREYVSSASIYYPDRDLKILEDAINQKLKREMATLLFEGKRLAYLQKWDEAIYRLNEVNDIDNEYAEPYFERARIYVTKKESELAISEYTKGLKRSPRDYAYYNRGMLYAEKQLYDQALSDYTKALEMNPKYAEVYWERAKLYFNKGLYMEFLSDCTRTLEIKSDYYDVYLTRGYYYYRIGRYDEAISDCSSAIGIRKWEFNPYYIRGRAYIEKERNDLALSDFTEASRIDPKNASCQFMRASLLVLKGNSNEAVEAYKQVIEYATEQEKPLAEESAGQIKRIESGKSINSGDILTTIVELGLLREIIKHNK